MNNQIYKELRALTIKILEQNASEREFRRLEEILKDDPAAQRHYTELLKVNTALEEAEAKGVESHFEAVAQVEQGRARAFDKSSVVFRSKMKGSKRSFDFSIPESKKNEFLRRLHLTAAWFAAGAAVVLLVLLINSRPEHNSYQVAAVDKLTGENIGLREGGKIFNTDPSVKLSDGQAAQLYTAYGAKVLVEGPAEFSMSDSEQLELASGRVFCSVPQNALGFRINSEKLRITDLGTQFGLEIASNGMNHLQVYKGKASIISGKEGQSVESRILEDGGAVRVSAEGRIENAEFSSHHFARELSSSSGILWRGQNFSLASVIGGANGLEAGRKNMALTFKNWKLQHNSEYGHLQYWDGFSMWNRIDHIPYIDSVFSTRSNGASTLSTTGLKYNFPPSRGDMFVGFSNGMVNWRRPVLDGIDYSKVDQEVLTFCANLGITFDMNQIRQRIEGVEIVEFKTRVGINDTGIKGLADIWVLIDGEPVRRIEKMKYSDPSVVISVPLSPSSRFLSLALSDGGDENANGGDWAVFVSPELVLTEK
ncbi:NPCBM/NEW2 domain-containing protein [Sedimentisphaera salicampi]|uniref:NPCBM/NEW2 domain-containing protein n=1 Tax=Sedimentisphaera salicampi TaxID=1941349 RepID=UPI000B9A4F3D|nr:NPCBM/NEW2 domain-containing protein [Sedimentisphaera salicampi]OXU14035.1 FecR protein [Sedimentisphaera salicampi]